MTILTLAEAARAIGSKTLSPVELTRSILERMDRLEPRLNAYVLRNDTAALTTARRAEAEISAGRYRGPMHGIPIALKDAIDVEGMPTTVSSRLRKDHRAVSSSFVWQQLEAQGAILLGKLENTEFCLGGPAEDTLFPHAKNPWDFQRYTGGSSSGAGTAVAAGLCLGALGTDTGGSVRFPAAMCGTAGLKPTYGRVSRRGVFPLSPSLDHVGPLAWTSEDCALMLQAMTAHDPHDDTSSTTAADDYTAGLCDDLKGMRIGIDRSWGAHCISPDVMASIEDAIQVLKGLGAVLVDLTLPDLWDYTAVNTTIMTSEAFSIHEQWLKTRWHEYTDFTRKRIALGAFVRASDLVTAHRMRRQLISSYRQLFRSLDAIVTAGMLAPAPFRRDMQAFYFLKAPLIYCATNTTGAPSLSVCTGFTDDNLPLAMQILGPHFGEAAILRVGHAYERATPWRERRPPNVM